MNTFTNLIKSAVVLFIATAIATPSTAQIHFENNQRFDLWSIPGSLQCDGHAKLFLSNCYEGLDVTYFRLLDEEMQIERELSYKAPILQRKTKTVYQERMANGYTESIDTLDYGYREQWLPGKSFAEVFEYVDGMLDCSKESCILKDGLYFLPEWRVGVPTIYDAFVQESGLVYYPSNGRIVAGVCTRQIALSDQWVTVREEVDEYESSDRLYSVYYDNHDEKSLRYDDVFLSQNFFNSDDKYEFIVRKYEPEEVVDTTYTDYVSDFYGEYEYAYKRKITYKTEFICRGFNVINEDGDIIYTFNTPVNPWQEPHLFTINGKNYACISSTDYSDKDNPIVYTDIYEINNQTNSIQKVQQLSNFSIQPRTPRRNEPVTVELLENEANQNHEVIVTSTDGRVAQRTTLHAGNKAVRLNTSRLNAGLYNVTVLKNGQKVESAKIIVR